MIVHPEGSKVWQMEQLLMEAAQRTHEVTRATGIMPVTPESLQGVSGASILQWGEAGAVLASQGLGSVPELES